MDELTLKPSDLFAGFFRQSVGLFGISDLDGLLVMVNPALAKALGLPVRDIVRSPWMTFIHEADRARVIALLAPLLKQTGAVSFSARFRGPFQTACQTLQCSVSSDPARSLLYFSAHKVDEDRPADVEMPKVEQQLLRMQRLENLGTLAGGIAHDLNNVLAPFQMSLELIRMKMPDPSLRSTLDTLDGCVKRGAFLARQILTMARGMKGERAALQPQHVLREIEKSLSHILPKSIAVSLELPSTLWPISADLTQLHQALINLCINARDAMPDGGSLSIGARNAVLDEAFVKMSQGASKGPHVCFDIKDNGSGIPSEIRSKIFEPFYTTRVDRNGGGLGLSTVAAIVKAHGGFVNVYSEVGRGTSFKIYWPALAGPGQQPNVDARTTFPIGNGELILIVDDEAAVCDIAGMMLQSHGYRVLQANDGAEGVAVYAQHQADIRLVISDMDMPVMNGAAMIRSLEQINPSVRVISASGLVSDPPAPESANPIRRILPKPYTASQLLGTVHALIARV